MTWHPSSTSSPSRDAHQSCEWKQIIIIRLFGKFRVKTYDLKQNCRSHTSQEHDWLPCCVDACHIPSQEYDWLPCCVDACYMPSQEHDWLPCCVDAYYMPSQEHDWLPCCVDACYMRHKSMIGYPAVLTRVTYVTRA